MVQRMESSQKNSEYFAFDEDVKAMGNPINNLYPNTYNPGWRNHPNFSWKDQRESLSQDQESGKKSLEKIVGELAQATSKFQISTESFINEYRNNYKNQNASIKNQENQVGHISKELTERPPGMFPSNTIPNPRENCSAITLRSRIL